MGPTGLSTQTTFFCTILPFTCIRLFSKFVSCFLVCLKWCNESAQVNFSCNPRKSLNLPNLQECVRFMRMHFLWLWYFREHSEKWIHGTKNWHTVYFLAILTLNCYFFHLYNFKYTLSAFKFYNILYQM